MACRILLSMPTDVDVAAAPVERDCCPGRPTVGGNGHLRVGDIDLLDLAAEFGTPLFVYDEYHLRQACREAVAAWGDGVAYATKAFLCRAMARLAHEEGMHLDVASGGELHVALSAGVPADRLVLHGNNKSEEELADALACGVGRIVVDSFDEIARLGRLLDGPSARSERPRVLVRVTPGVEAHTHEFVRTGQEDSKFGFSVLSGAAAQAVAALELLPGAELVGVHAHIGSQVFEASSFEQAAEVLGAFFAPLGLPELVVGGGLGVPYVNGESAPTQAEWARATRAACARVGVDPATRISAEPGRSIVGGGGDHPLHGGDDQGPSGHPHLCQRRRRHERQSAAGPLRQRVRGIPAPCRRGGAATFVRLVGKHCESGDLIVPEAFVPEDLRVGDIMATPVTGAYGYAMASNYNKVPRPAVVFVADGSARVVVRRETFDDMTRLDS
jgi:diaminopimelate decarboxylase